tara:strand:+ start:3293 stop:3577 length:285 start_codon:yes stop_codon:yes gene_type:complete
MIAVCFEVVLHFPGQASSIERMPSAVFCIIHADHGNDEKHQKNFESKKILKLKKFKTEKILTAIIDMYRPRTRTAVWEESCQWHHLIENTALSA